MFETFSEGIPSEIGTAKQEKGMVFPVFRGEKLNVYAQIRGVKVFHFLPFLLRCSCGELDSGKNQNGLISERIPSELSTF